jgi:hypothetical protein
MILMHVPIATISLQQNDNPAKPICRQAISFNTGKFIIIANLNYMDGFSTGLFEPPGNALTVYVSA